jgi:hypothetical protein
MIRTWFARTLGLTALAVVVPMAVEAQLTPVRAQAARPVELTFPTPRHITLPTNEPLASGEFYYSIMHTFGEVSQGAGTFWGIDSGANVRFAMEYGFTDRFSFLLARSSMDRVYEMTGKLRLLDQMSDGSFPVSVGVHLTGGIQTLDEILLADDVPWLDRTHIAASVPISHQVRDGVSVMVVPMGARFRETYATLRLADPADRTVLGLGLGARVKVGRLTSLTGQWIPTRGSSSETVRSVVGLGADLETGGHVFQLYFTNVQGLNDAYVLAAPVGQVTDGGLRFGFNVNRSFSVR